MIGLWRLLFLERAELGIATIEVLAFADILDDLAVRLGLVGAAVPKKKQG